MIDLHSHILPGIDDGARSLEEAVAMCRLAAADGCEAMAATPHQWRGPWWNTDREELDALRGRLQEAVGGELRILAGGEIHVDVQLFAELESLLRADPAEPGSSGILPLAGSRYLLLEFASSGSPDAAADLVHELSVAGWRPILAHPEFIAWMAEDRARVEQLVALGAFVQVTAMSITGDFGRRAQSDCNRLLEAGLVHFVASDSHDLRRRPPGLKRAYRTIAARWGEETARRLVSDHPRAVVEDRPLPAPQAPVAPSRGESAGGSEAGP
ncbi:MAG TPA: CpsB/CapC family capsule biosynthesis tyrosine phosphatase [Thermoanaerobaculia bacterium]|nr:CpsB/CapC family capsule biosynthesis tyrosine phosphatase [Thermoanaerobaculia bacterium]